MTSGSVSGRCRRPSLRVDGEVHLAEQALVRPCVAEGAAAGERFPALDVQPHLVSRHGHRLRMRHSTATPTTYSAGARSELSTARRSIIPIRTLPPRGPTAPSRPYLFLRRVSSP